MSQEETFEMVYDSVDQRPACVLLQAAYGCPTEYVQLYDTDLWHIAPTPNFVKVICTVAQVTNHAERMNAQHK